MSFRPKETSATRSRAGSNWLGYATVLSSVQPASDAPKQSTGRSRRRRHSNHSTGSRQNENTNNSPSQNDNNDVESVGVGCDDHKVSVVPSKAMAKPATDRGSDNRPRQPTIMFGPSKSGRPFRRHDRDSESSESGSDVSPQPRFRVPPRHRFVAMDCEMVGVGHRGSHDMLARVSIVNRNGDVLLDKYVSPQERVTDYRTRISGIRPHNINNGEPFSKVQDEVINILQGKILVGHALRKDMEVLSIKHPPFNIRDTANYRPLAILVSNGRTPGLKKLTKAVFGQDIQVGEHNSVEDARAAMRIYDHFSEEWEEALLKNRYASRLRNYRSQQQQKMLKLKEQQKLLKRQAQVIATTMPPAAESAPLNTDNGNGAEAASQVGEQGMAKQGGAMECFKTGSNKPEKYKNNK